MGPELPDVILLFDEEVKNEYRRKREYMSVRGSLTESLLSVDDKNLRDSYEVTNSETIIEL